MNFNNAEALEIEKTINDAEAAIRELGELEHGGEAPQRLGAQVGELLLGEHARGDHRGRTGIPARCRQRWWRERG